jgi:hypothetical protein
MPGRPGGNGTDRSSQDVNIIVLLDLAGDGNTHLYKVENGDSTELSGSADFYGGSRN